MAEVEKLAAWFTSEGIVSFETEKGLVGGAAYDVHKTAISDADMGRAQAADAVLLAAVGGPKWDAVPYEVRPEAGLLPAPQGYASFRQSAPGDLLSGAGRCLFAEARARRRARSHDRSRINRRRLFGEPKQIIDLGNGQRRAIDTQVYDTYEIERIGRIAFELARKRRNKVTSSDKRNVMKSGVLWDEVIRDLHKREYPDVELEHQLADALGMQLVRRPKQFDVIVTDNLFGDMLSDVASMLTGSLGMLPSASLGEKMPRAKPARRSISPCMARRPTSRAKG